MKEAGGEMSRLEESQIAGISTMLQDGEEKNHDEVESGRIRMGRRAKEIPIGGCRAWGYKKSTVGMSCHLSLGSFLVPVAGRVK